MEHNEVGNGHNAQLKFKVRFKRYSTLADNPDKYQRGFLFGNTSMCNQRGTNITTTKFIDSIQISDIEFNS